MGSHSLAVTLSALLARYPTDVRISCGALDTPPARCALLQHDINDVHQPVMLFRLTRISQKPLYNLSVLQASFLAPAHAAVSTARGISTHRPPARDKPQALSPALRSTQRPRLAILRVA